MKLPICLLSLCLIFLASCGQNKNKENIADDSDSSALNPSIHQVVEPKALELPQSNSIKPQIDANYQIVQDIPCPKGYVRVESQSNSFGNYLRNLPLKTENNKVYLFDGSEKWSQGEHFAVLKMDVGSQDLQQCADAVMRLRAEYLFEQTRFADIHFNFLSDAKPRYYTDYAKQDRTYNTFRRYMNYIFAYANTRSLRKEMKSVAIQNMQIGDVFIQSGNPYGHAITVMDMAKNEKGEKVFMVSQSFMPAQEIHILLNKRNDTLNPWYALDFGETLITPEWTFKATDLKRFED